MEINVFSEKTTSVAQIKKILKNGREKIYKYDIAFKNKCEICGGSYSNNNKSHHLKTNKHKYGELQKLVKTLQQINNN